MTLKISAPPCLCGYVCRDPLADARGSVLSEDVAHLVEQALVAEVFLFDLGELFEELAVLGGEGRWRDGDDGGVEVAAPAPAERRHAVAFDAEDRPRLRAGGDFQVLLAVERLHVHLRAERGLREGDGNGSIKVVALPLEEFVLFDVDDDVEVARRAALRPRLALAREPQARAGLDPRRIPPLHLLLALDAPRAATLLARVADALARAAATAARPSHGEEALLVAHLPRAPALLAAFGLRAGRGPAALAVLAGFEARDSELRRHPGGGLFERHLQIVAEVCGALRPRAPSARPGTSAEHVAEAEEVAEDVLDAAEPLRAPARRAPRARRDSGVAEVVVARALLGVGEDGVGFRRLLESLLGLMVAGVLVRVVADGELAVGALDLGLARAPAHAEDFVVVAFAAHL